mgnify:CR=1 FL=1
MCSPAARKSRGQVRRPPAAFTLIELLVVVAIIALLISILVPSLSQAREQAKRARCGANLEQIGVGLQSCRHENRDCIPLLDDGVALNMYTWLDVLYELDYVGSIDIQRCPSRVPNEPAMVARGQNWGFRYTERFGVGEQPKWGVRTSYAINALLTRSWSIDMSSDAARQVVVLDGFWNWFGNMSAHWSMAPFVLGYTLAFNQTFATWQGAMIGFRHGNDLTAMTLFMDSHVAPVTPRRPRNITEYRDFLKTSYPKMIDTAKVYSWLPGESTRRLDVWYYGSNLEGEVAEWQANGSDPRWPAFSDRTIPGWYRPNNHEESAVNAYVPAYYPADLAPAWRTAKLLWSKLPPDPRHRD